MRWTQSTRLGALVGIPLVITAALATPVWADEPVLPSSGSKPPVVWGDAKAGHVREVQQGLLSAGYDPGPVDGIMGPRTKSALRKYIAVPPPQVPSLADQTLASFRANERREAR
jgi:putative peptidoglycan binding protein